MKINLDELTLGQLKEIKSLVSSGEQRESFKKSFLKDYIGKYVIVRTRNEGINFGKVKEIDESGVVISEARRIYYHRPKDNTVSWYEGVAQTGLSNDSKISCETTKVIIEGYSLTLCSDEAIDSIKSAKSQTS